MFRRILFSIFFCCFIFGWAQQGEGSFEKKASQLKQKDNLAEFIYIHLDKFAANPNPERLSIFDQLEEELWKKPDSNAEKTAYFYFLVNWAYYLKQYGQIGESVYQYERALNAYTKGAIENYDIYEYCIKPLTNNLLRLGDLNRAEKMIRSSFEIVRSKGNASHLASNYASLAVVLRMQGNYSSAIEFLFEAIDFTKDVDKIGALYSDIAINYLFLENCQMVMKYVELSEKTQLKPSLSVAFRNAKSLGSCKMFDKDYEASLKHYNKALKLAQQYFKSNDREIAKVHILIGEVYKLKKNFEKSLEYYQNALRTLLPEGTDDPYQDVDISSIYAENSLKEAFDGKAVCFSLMKKKEEALKNYNYSFLVEDALRSTYVDERSKIRQQQFNRVRSEHCIELCFELYEESRDDQWFSMAFEYAEATKSRLLVEARQNTLWKSPLKSDSLIQRELFIKKRNAVIDESIVLERLKGNQASEHLLSQWIGEKATLQTELNLVRRAIFDKYPVLDHDRSIEDLTEMVFERIVNKHVDVIEYFDGAEFLYIFHLSKDNHIQLNRIAKDTLFHNTMRQFLSFYEAGDGIKLMNDPKGYFKVAFTLYNYLIPEGVNENILVIPDGQLSFVPFDALVYEKTTKENYTDIPFLVETTTIGYAYSCGLMTIQDTNNDKKRARLAGFFPVFENSERGLSRLSNTVQESKSIAKRMNGDHFEFENATKSAFINATADYSIVHLSTHASTANGEMPPKIEFYDESLLLPEIYGLDLNTDLMVLSACETGIGYLSKGEGAISLARAFTFSGVRNMMASLWKVNDQATEHIMSHFYRNYKGSSAGAGSIRNAKLAYLNDTSIRSAKKTPFYWAAFVHVGEFEHEISEKNHIPWIVAGILIILGFIILKRSRFTAK